MKKMSRYALLGVLFSLLITACATTDYDLMKRKAMSDDYRRLGDAYSRQGDYTRALRYYLEAAKQYADDPQLQYSLGQTYSEKQNFARAIDHFQKALELDPDMAPVKNSLGVAYIEAGEYEKAVAVLKQMIEDQGYEIYARPQYPKYNLGWALYQQKNYREAERYLQEALDYYDTGVPKDAIYVKALRAQGLNALALSNPEKALAYLEKVIPFAPKWADIYLDLARAYRQTGATDQARKAYDRVMELAPATDLAATAAREAATL